MIWRGLGRQAQGEENGKNDSNDLVPGFESHGFRSGAGFGNFTLSAQRGRGKFDMPMVFPYKKRKSTLEAIMLALWLIAEAAEGPNTELAWLVLVVMGFLLAAVAAGWLSRLGAGDQAKGGNEAESSSQKDDAPSASPRRQPGVPRTIAVRRGKSGRKIR
jgi:hypothetical protein